MSTERSRSIQAAISKELEELISCGEPGERLPTIRDFMKKFQTSQRVVQRALEPLIEEGTLVSKSGFGLRIAAPVEVTRVYTADCLILYRNSESRLAQTLLMELVNRLRRAGYQVVLQSFDDEDRAIAQLDRLGKFRCCLIQTNFEIVSIRFLARIREMADALVVDGVSVTGIDADVIGTNWREALSIGYRKLLAQGHQKISFLTSAHDARQIAMARREFRLLSNWAEPEPHPHLFVVDRLPGSYKQEEVLEALPSPGMSSKPSEPTALIVWGLVDGYILDAALHKKGLKLGRDFSILLLGSVDVASEHVARFDVVGNSNSEKLDLFERVVRSRIEGDPSPPKTHYLPVYVLENGSTQLIQATSKAER